MRRRRPAREDDPRRQRLDQPAHVLMMFTWAWRVPELKRLPQAQRRLAVGRAIHSMHAIIIPVVLLLGIPTILLLCTSFGRLVTRLSGTAGLVVLVMVPFGLVIGTALGFACSLLLTTPLRRAVRREMNVLGLPICTGCGYNLAGLACDPSTCADVRVCPECGADLPAPG